uniref:Uncharacterized protein n=1 Tax=Trieres chinensis TaxID=1514140 RepID=A0A7S1Z3T0_TRICV
MPHVPGLKKRVPIDEPMLVDWTLMSKGRIGGKIYGSNHFLSGEQVTTSPIVAGTIQNYSFVETENGTRYFLCSDPHKGVDGRSECDSYANDFDSEGSSTVSSTTWSGSRSGSGSRTSMGTSSRESSYASSTESGLRSEFAGEVSLAETSMVSELSSASSTMTGTTTSTGSSWTESS